MLLSIVLLNRSRLPLLRLAAIVIGLALGTLAAWATGLFVPRALPELPLVSLPQLFRFGFAFDWMAFLPVALDLPDQQHRDGRRPDRQLHALAAALRAGVSAAVARRSARRRRQLPAGSHLQRLPEHHLRAEQRVIQLTGVASRHVGIYIGGVLLALGLFPWIGAILQQIPCRCSAAPPW